MAPHDPWSAERDVEVFRRQHGLPGEEGDEHRGQAEREDTAASTAALPRAPGTPGDGGEGGCGQAARVLVGDHHDPEHSDRELGDLDPGEADVNRIETGGVGRRPGDPTIAYRMPKPTISVTALSSDQAVDETIGTCQLGAHDAPRWLPLVVAGGTRSRRW